MVKERGPDMRTILDRIPFTTLLFIAVLMLILPVSPRPHVVEKFMMLKNGELTKFIDIFDLFYHLMPSFFLILKVVVTKTHKAN